MPVKAAAMDPGDDRTILGARVGAAGIRIPGTQIGIVPAGMLGALGLKRLLTPKTLKTPKLKGFSKFCIGGTQLISYRVKTCGL